MDLYHDRTVAFVELYKPSLLFCNLQVNRKNFSKILAINKSQIYINIKPRENIYL